MWCGPLLLNLYFILPHSPLSLSLSLTLSIRLIIWMLKRMGVLLQHSDPNTKPPYALCSISKPGERHRDREAGSALSMSMFVFFMLLKLCWIELKQGERGIAEVRIRDRVGMRRRIIHRWKEGNIYNEGRFIHHKWTIVNAVIALKALTNSNPTAN